MNNPNNSDVQQSEDASATLSALLNAAVDAMIIIDHKGTIELFNEAAETMFCYEAGSVLGKNVKILMPDPYHSEHDQYLQHYKRTNEKRIIGKGREVKARKSSGEIFPIELSVGEVKGASHKQFVGIIRDITNMVKAREDAIKNRVLLDHATRLSNMGEMAAGIAHEINQPLTAIVSYAQACVNMLGQKASNQPAELPTEKIIGVLNKLSKQARRASEVTDQIRTFVKQQKTQRETVDLNSLIKETVELAKVDSRLNFHGVELHLNCEPKPVINADPTQIQQVLLNLIRNATDAMESQLNEPVCICSKWLDHQSIEVSVCDTGCGVNEANQSCLFDPFFSTKDAGMGMGLPISRSIMLAHGGDLKYRQGVPKGSVFVFSLLAEEIQLNNI
jgi:two-component system sensor kinase FixL